jgi:hypothetical protein
VPARIDLPLKGGGEASSVATEEATFKAANLSP